MTVSEIVEFCTFCSAALMGREEARRIAGECVAVQFAAGSESLPTRDDMGHSIYWTLRTREQAEACVRYFGLGSVTVVNERETLFVTPKGAELAHDVPSTLEELVSAVSKLGTVTVAA